MTEPVLKGLAPDALMEPWAGAVVNSIESFRAFRAEGPGVRLLVSPASWDIYRQCLDAGLQKILIEAGAQFLNPGCGVCTKGAYLAPGETCISATTRIAISRRRPGQRNRSRDGASGRW